MLAEGVGVRNWHPRIRSHAQQCPRRPAAKSQRDVLITNQQNGTLNELQITFRRKRFAAAIRSYTYNRRQQWAFINESLVEKSQISARINRKLSVPPERRGQKKDLLSSFTAPGCCSHSYIFTLFFLCCSKSNLNKLRSSHSLFCSLGDTQLTWRLSYKLYTRIAPLRVLHKLSCAHF